MATESQPATAPEDQPVHASRTPVDTISSTTSSTQIPMARDVPVAASPSLAQASPQSPERPFDQTPRIPSPKTLAPRIAESYGGQSCDANAGIDPIEADATHGGSSSSINDNYSDDGYESDDAPTISTSISSSVRDYAFESGRRYHKFQEGRYQFPNDEPEQEREDMKHAMIIHLCGGKLHFAPLQNPQKILDIGTGTGVWAIDMADEYPEADVTGIDLSPIQPSWVPPNVRFIVDDAEADWVYPPDSLDYIHIRHMTSSIRDWPTLLSRAFEALKPGGWIEVQELCFVIGCDDGTVTSDNQVVDFFNKMKQGLAAFNVDLLAMTHNPERLQKAGFANIDETVLKIPLGVWPRDATLKTVGLYNRSVINDALQGVAVKPFTHGLKWTMPEIEVYLMGVRKSLMDSRQHGYIPFHIVTGQKPF